MTKEDKKELTFTSPEAFVKFISAVNDDVRHIIAEKEDLTEESAVSLMTSIREHMTKRLQEMSQNEGQTFHSTVFDFVLDACFFYLNFDSFHMAKILHSGYLTRRYDMVWNCFKEASETLAAHIHEAASKDSDDGSEA